MLASKNHHILLFSFTFQFACSVASAECVLDQSTFELAKEAGGSVQCADRAYYDTLKAGNKPETRIGFEGNCERLKNKVVCKSGTLVKYPLPSSVGTLPDETQAPTPSFLDEERGADRTIPGYLVKKGVVSALDCGSPGGSEPLFVRVRLPEVWQNWPSRDQNPIRQRNSEGHCLLYFPQKDRSDNYAKPFVQEHVYIGKLLDSNAGQAIVLSEKAYQELLISLPSLEPQDSEAFIIHQRKKEGNHPPCFALLRNLAGKTIAVLEDNRLTVIVQNEAVTLYAFDEEAGDIVFSGRNMPGVFSVRYDFKLQKPGTSWWSSRKQMLNAELKIHRESFNFGDKQETIKIQYFDDCSPRVVAFPKRSWLETLGYWLAH